MRGELGDLLRAEHPVQDLAQRRHEAPPELVVEVASARTRFYDRNRKKDVYEGFGIPV
jgi:Uma2 family endonuclease